MSLNHKRGGLYLKHFQIGGLTRVIVRSHRARVMVKGLIWSAVIVIDSTTKKGVTVGRVVNGVVVV